MLEITLAGKASKSLLLLVCKDKQVEKKDGLVPKIAPSKIEGEIAPRNLHYWKSRVKLLRGNSTTGNQGRNYFKEAPLLEIKGEVTSRNLYS